ncbi:MAG: ATP-binding protein [Lachnospiraceae bacterium]|nr:ATP-binding protein [Lachnospiraceae bacterium]
MKKESNMQLVSRLLFRLLPVQFFLALVSCLNAIISGLFATNYIGIDAMTAIGLYAPIAMFFSAISTMLMGGATIICGKYMGRNEKENVQGIFTLDNLLSLLVAAVFIVLFVVCGAFNLTGFITSDTDVRPIFNEYLLGQAIGVLPLIIGNQLASFLSLENKVSRTTTASFVYIVVNVALNYVFVVRMGMEAFGLALASSIGLWVFLLIQAQYFFTAKSPLRFFTRQYHWKETIQIIKIGFPGAASFGYQTVRGLIVNKLLELFVGTVGISAFTAANTLMGIAWALPTGMVAVSRMLISISVGEEDRQTLVDTMRNMFYRFLPLMSAICALIILCAKPLTMCFYRDTTEPVFMMTVWGFRILPLCMPLSIICMHFTCYGQASGKQGLVNLLSVVDGVICVAGFTALLIKPIGMNSVYIANVLNGVVTTIIVWGYAVIRHRKFPGNVDELMVIPEDFGVPAEARMDISVKNLEEVVGVAEAVQQFCRKRGIDGKRAYYAALALEEMAGNVVSHGFTKDKKNHTVDIRVVHKDDTVLLRIKDDCVAFDPAVRVGNVRAEEGTADKITDSDTLLQNIGIRMIYKMTEKINYQNILGLNVLTIELPGA